MHEQDLEAEGSRGKVRIDCNRRECGPSRLNRVALAGLLSLASMSQPAKAASALIEAQPVFSVPGGTYVGAQTVTITEARPSSTVYYTTDGSIPTTSSSKYMAGIAIDSSETLRAIAVGPTSAQSLVTSATYTIAAQAPVSIISTVAGMTWSNFGMGGPATSAYLPTPTGVAADSAGNFYIEGNQCQIFKVNAASGVITLIAGASEAGYSGKGQLAVNAQFICWGGIAVDSAGNVYKADANNNVVWKINAASGVMTVVAGVGTSGFAGDGQAATKAKLAQPEGVAVDASGNIYIADEANNVVRKVDVTGTIRTIAGTAGKMGSTGNGDAATSALLGWPADVVVDKAGNLYIGDIFTNQVRKIDPAGIITLFAGNGDYGITGDNGQATAAALGGPATLALDGSGNLYIGQTNYNVVRKVTSSTGIITTVAGNGTEGFTGDGGPGTSAALYSHGVSRRMLRDSSILPIFRIIGCGASTQEARLPRLPATAKTRRCPMA